MFGAGFCKRIEANHLIARARNACGHGASHIAEADDGDLGGRIDGG
jgi:hypothetical protein